MPVSSRVASIYWNTTGGESHGNPRKVQVWEGTVSSRRGRREGGSMPEV